MFHHFSALANSKAILRTFYDHPNISHSSIPSNPTVTVSIPSLPGEDVIQMYKSEVQQLKGKLQNEPAVTTRQAESGNVEEMRRLIELEYNIGKETKNCEDKEFEKEYLSVLQERPDVSSSKTEPKHDTFYEDVLSNYWISLVLILVSVPVLFMIFPGHVVITCVVLYLSTLAYLIWKETGGSGASSKTGEGRNALSYVVSDIYEENESLKKTVEQLIVRVASETVAKNELAKQVGKDRRASDSKTNKGERRESTSAKDSRRELAEKEKIVESLTELRKSLTDEAKQLKAKLHANEAIIQQKDKVIKKLESKLRDLMDGEDVDISTETILQEIRDDDKQNDAKKRTALERFQLLTASVMKNAKNEGRLGTIFVTCIVAGLVLCVLSHSSLLVGSSLLAMVTVLMGGVLWYIRKSRHEMATLVKELNMEAELGLESSKEIQELSTLVEKHHEVVTKQKRAITALERQLNVEHSRNENQKMIITKLTRTIQEGKDIANLQERSKSYRGQNRKPLDMALSSMAEDHTREKLELLKTMRTHLVDEDVVGGEMQWITQDLKKLTEEFKKTTPNVPQSTRGLKMADMREYWKYGAMIMTSLLVFLCLFYSQYFALSLLPLIACSLFVVLKKTGPKRDVTRDTKIRRITLDILFVCITIATVSWVHSNEYLQPMAFVLILATAVVRFIVKKLVTSDESALSQQKSREIEELRERVEEEIRRRKKVTEQMETWKRLLEVERSYNKESDDVITEVREMEQRAQREVRREMEQLRKEKREYNKHIEELETELKKSTTHRSKQRRQMEELNKVIKELEKKQKQHSKEMEVLKELNKYEKEELSVALEGEKKARQEFVKNAENEKEKTKRELTTQVNVEKKQLANKVTELERRLSEERKMAKDFLEQVDAELAKNERLNTEMAEVKVQMGLERQTRDNLRKRFQEINEIRKDREKALLDQIDELQEQLSKQKVTLEMLTQGLEKNKDGKQSDKTKSPHEVQGREILDLQRRLSIAAKTIEDMRQQKKSTMKDLKDLKEKYGTLLKDTGALQDKSTQDNRTIQRKQKEIEDLKTSLQRLHRENDKLGKKPDDALLETSLGARVAKVEVDKQNTEGQKGDKGMEMDGMGLDEAKKEEDEKNSMKTQDEAIENDGVDTDQRGGPARGGLTEVLENEEYLQDEKSSHGVPADFASKDTQGILYMLGTMGNTEDWKNPAEAGYVKITRSSNAQGKASDIAERKGSWCSTSNKANQWWKIDFGEKRCVLATGYTLQHGWSGASGALRNWVLEGSRDGKVWHILKNHVNDETLDKGYAAATWKIDDIIAPYRYLRVRQTGKNEAGKDSLRLSGFEVYGELMFND